MKAVSASRIEAGNITAEDLRSIPCMKGMSDHELEGAAAFIVQFTEIAYGVFSSSKVDSSATIIKLDSLNHKTKAA